MKEYFTSLLRYAPSDPDGATTYLILLSTSVFLALSSAILVRLFRFKRCSDKNGSEITVSTPSWSVQGMGYLLSLTPQPESFLRWLTYVEISFRRLFQLFFLYFYLHPPGLTVI